MKKDRKAPESAAELRRRAEARVEEGLGPAAGSPIAGTPTSMRLLHELQVHQIELELQNEELQRSGAALEKALARYSELYECAPIGYLSLAHDGEIQQTNIAGARLLGGVADELVGKRLGVFVAAESLPTLNAFLLRVWGSGTETACEIVTREEGSERRTLSVTGTARGYIACVIVDVTERRRAEAALVRSEGAYRQLFQDNPVPMCVVDAATTSFLAANDPFLALYGYGRQALLAMRFTDLRGVGGAAAAALPGFKGTAVHRTSLGTDINVELSAHDLPFEGRAARLVAIKDLTAQQRLEEQLRQVQKMEAVGRLAGGIAHDFNNLLTIVLSYASLILKGLGPEDPVRADLEEITKAGNRAAELTRQLLMFSRRQVLLPQVLNLNALVLSTDRMLRRILGEDIEVVTILEPSLGGVFADEGSLHQVIMNLVVNARDAMPTGGRLTIETTNVQFDAATAGESPGLSPGPHVRLTVSDTGSGMAADTLSRIFEPFFTTKEQGKGTGLGLSMVFGVVQQSGGAVRVRSELGKGTTFTVDLPRTDVVAQVPETLEAASRPPAHHETILLVEDEGQVRRVARKVLERRGYHVLEASNAAEALLLSGALAEPIDLLLTDVVMPGMNGRELSRQLVRTWPGLKVLCMSGYTGEEFAHQRDDNHGVAFLQKPFTPESLSAKVREVLDTPPVPRRSPGA